jgi:hypothetical protein
MPKMVRKQIYIYQRQEAQLKRISDARGISEAEIVRAAIDREAQAITPTVFHPDPEAYEQLMKFFEQRKSIPPTGEPYRWSREDAYDDPRTKRLLGEG